MGIKTTINLRNTDGTLLDLTLRVKELAPTLNGLSIIDMIAKPTGMSSWLPGYVFKTNRRTQSKYDANTAIGKASGFAGASAQVVSSVLIDKIYRQDSIIASRMDLEYLKQGKGGDLISQEVSNFLLTARELDVKELILDGVTKANSMNIYTSVTKSNASDLYATVPSGVQPTQTTNSYADALIALNGGKRIIQSTELDLASDNRINLIRASISYLSRIGADNSPETFYPYSINGIPLTSIKILGFYDSIRKIKDSFTTTIVNLNAPGTTRKLNSLVAYIDGIEVYSTNQMGVDSEYVILSDRVFARDLDPLTQYVGVIAENATTAVMADASIVAVKPSEIVVRLESGRLQGTKFFEEIIQINKV